MSDNPLGSKEAKDMTREELRIMTLIPVNPFHPSNPYHERLFKLEEEDRIENQKIQHDIKRKTDGIYVMNIFILLFTAVAVIVSILALHK